MDSPRFHASKTYQEKQEKKYPVPFYSPPSFCDVDDLAKTSGIVFCRHDVTCATASEVQGHHATLLHWHSEAEFYQG
ncbi:MAG: hypothetical protein K8F52_04860 [Candidatus Scalindua rubra]|nr:hypothetical protein [Candidatus Scalindua rubra]